MLNPYAIAFSRVNVRATVAAPPRREVPKCTLTPKMSKFLDAMAIGHGGNRAKVCTAIAHLMSDEEIVGMIGRLLANREERVQKLTELDAPEVILVNARKEGQWAVRILERVRGVTS